MSFEPLRITLKQHKIALGTVQFGLHYGISNTQGVTPLSEVKSILTACREQGVTMIDTASAYGDAEHILGDAGVNEFQVVSKFMPNGGVEEVEKQLAHSLENLGVSRLYGYLAHRPTELLKQPWEWALLQEKKSQGIIQKLGFSLNRPAELHELLDRGYYPDIVQVPYNYLDRRFEADFENLKKAGVEIHTRSAFLQGLFFMDPTKLPDFFEPLKPVLTNLHKTVPNLFGELLKFVIDNTMIDYVVVGVESLNQFNANLKNLLNADKHLGNNNIGINENILIPSNWPKY